MQICNGKYEKKELDKNAKLCYDIMGKFDFARANSRAKIFFKTLLTKEKRSDIILLEREERIMVKKSKIENLELYKLKMSSEELQLYMHFKKRSFAVPSKKGKGSYNRKKLSKIY